MTPPEEAAAGTAPARTALAGNPSDGYGGAVLALTLDQLGARAVATRSATTRISPASSLIDATLHRFARELEPAAASTAIEWRTSIPERVGLGGSSAIVIAVARALCKLYAVELAPARLAALALTVEREDLGIPGGRQDQLSQAHGGLTLMDFGVDPDGRVERLEPALLPPLVVAWHTDFAEHSGIVHAGLRSSYDRGAMVALAELARSAAAALEAGDHEAFARCVDRSFDARAQMLELDPQHTAMIERARSCDACANYTGSGGAIVAACRDETHRDAVLVELQQLGCGVLAAG